MGADPASGQKPIQKEQGADRPLEEPAGELADADSEEKAKTEDTQAGEPPSGALPSTGVSDPLGTVTVNPGPEMDTSGIQTETKGSGTGEQYVKCTGPVADRGEFDASEPGADRKAHREFLFPFVFIFVFFALISPASLLFSSPIPVAPLPVYHFILFFFALLVLRHTTS